MIAMKRLFRFRRISFYVEWTDDRKTDRIIDLLQNEGVHVADIDDDIDHEHYPDTKSKHLHTVFHLRAERTRPIYEIMSAVAESPDVFSVSLM